MRKCLFLLAAVVGELIIFAGGLLALGLILSVVMP
jgi:hypothetical protein